MSLVAGELGDPATPGGRIGFDLQHHAASDSAVGAQGAHGQGGHAAHARARTLRMAAVGVIATINPAHSGGRRDVRPDRSNLM